MGTSEWLYLWWCGMLCYCPHNASHPFGPCQFSSTNKVSAKHSNCSLLLRYLAGDAYDLDLTLFFLYI